MAKMKIGIAGSEKQSVMTVEQAPIIQMQEKIIIEERLVEVNIDEVVEKVLAKIPKQEIHVSEPSEVIRVEEKTVIEKEVISEELIRRIDHLQIRITQVEEEAQRLLNKAVSELETKIAKRNANDDVKHSVYMQELSLSNKTEFLQAEFIKVEQKAKIAIIASLSVLAIAISLLFV